MCDLEIGYNNSIIESGGGMSQLDQIANAGLVRLLQNIHRRRLLVLHLLLLVVEQRQ